MVGLVEPRVPYAILDFCDEVLRRTPWAKGNHTLVLNPIARRMHQPFQPSKI